MNSNSGEHNGKATLVSNPERIHRDGRQIATAASTATPIENQLIASQSFETTLEKVIVPVPKKEREDTLDAFQIAPCRETALS